MFNIHDKENHQFLTFEQANVWLKLFDHKIDVQGCLFVQYLITTFDLAVSVDDGFSV